MAEHMICTVDGCDNPVSVKIAGLCNKHYLRGRRYGDVHFSKINRDQTGKPCNVTGCMKPSGRLGMCQAHYKRAMAYGDPEKFHPRYKCGVKWIENHAGHNGDDCLKWPFSVGDQGRGTVQINGRVMSSPRYMCMLAHGKPPSRKHHAAHSCGNGHLGCVNPMHLRWATAAENEADKLAHGTLRRGTDINTNKLSEDQVREIRALEGVKDRKEVASMYGVNPVHVWDIQTRRAWKWLA